MTKKINLIFLSTLILYSLFCALQLGYTWDVLFYYEVGKERLDYLFFLSLIDMKNLYYFISSNSDLNF